MTIAAPTRPTDPEARVGLVALDLDGTMLGRDGRVSPRTRSAIRALLDGGIGVCIATGRSWWESRGAIAEAGLRGPGAFVGGAIVNEMSDGAMIADEPMIPEHARTICRVIDAYGMSAMVMQDRGRAAVEWLIAAEHGMPPTVPEWIAHHGSSYECRTELWAADHALTVRISTVAPHARNAALADALDAALGANLYLHTITVPSTGISVLEVFDAHVNKWTGVAKIAAMAGVELARVVAVGDDMNDLPMLRAAGVGAAMGNARPKVKAAADLTLGGNDADGLAAYLEQMLAGGGTVSAARRPG